jgi:hypothetical protein
MTDTDTKEQTTMTAEKLFNILSNHPYPGANNLTQVTSELMYFNVDGLWIGYDKGMWKAEMYLTQYPITPNFPPFGELTVRDVHAEISRVVKIGKSHHANTRAVVTETVTNEQKTTTTETDPNGFIVHRLLRDDPYPGMMHLRMSLDCVCRFFLNGKTWRFDYDVWEVGDEKIEHNLPVAEQVTAEMLHCEIRRVSSVLDGITNDCIDAEQTIKLDNALLMPVERYRELEEQLKTVRAEFAKREGELIDQRQGWYSQAQDAENKLKTMTASRDATQERVEALQQLLPLFGLGVNAPTDKAREKIEGLYGRVKELGLMANSLIDQLKTVTEERDTHKASYDYAQNLLNQVWDATGWLEAADKNPCGIDYLKRLKSKADRAGLLSVVCRRLCGDENASIETVHKALDRVDNESKALDYIGEKVGSVPFHLGEVQSLVVQAVKSLGEKTVEVEQLKETISWSRTEMEKLRFERDAEHVGKKWLSETIEDIKRTTVKLPNEHALRRLFNRHNTPDKYDDGTPIPTIERFLLIIENLCRNADCSERRFEELNAISTRVNTESEDAHATLDEMGVPRWTTTNNHNERYLSLSARIRSLFNTKV